MKLDVKNLVFAPVGAKESLTVELFTEKIDEDVLAERIKGTLNLTRLEEEILAQFSGSVKTSIACDRCLAEYGTEVPLNFSQEYLINIRPDDDMKLVVSRDFKIDIIEPIRQEILAGLPLKKLCKSDCLGICPGCGENLNESQCKCKQKKV